MGAHASSLRAGLAADFEAALEAREEAAERERGRNGGEKDAGDDDAGRSTTFLAPTIPPRFRNALVLSEVLSLAAAPRAWDVGPPSLTLMMALDSDRDGLVTLDELAAFGAAAFTAASSSASSSSPSSSTFCEAVRGAAALAAAAELSGGNGGGEGRSSLFPACPRCDEDCEELSHAARERATDWLLSLVVADDALRSAVRGEAGSRPDFDDEGGGGGEASNGDVDDGGGKKKPSPFVHSASLRALVELLAPFDEGVGGCSGGGCSYNHFHHPGVAERGGNGKGKGEDDELERRSRRRRNRRRRDREEEGDRAFAAIFDSLKAAARATAAENEKKPLPATSKRQNRDDNDNSGDCSGDCSGDSDGESDSDPLADWVPASAVRHLGKGAIDGVARLLGRVCGEESGGGRGGGRGGEGVFFFGARRGETLCGDGGDTESSSAPCDLCGGGGGSGGGRGEGSVARRLWDASVAQAV